MFDMHHIGGFILNTIKPLIEEVDKILGECKNLNIDKEERMWLLKELMYLELAKTYAQFATYMILGVVGCLTVYFILR